MYYLSYVTLNYHLFDRLQGEMEDMMIECERSTAIANQAEKRQRAFDKTIDEWKRKVADVQSELERSNAEGRGNAAEVYKLRAQMDETGDTIEALRRENKNLSGIFMSIYDFQNPIFFFLDSSQSVLKYNLVQS